MMRVAGHASLRPLSVACALAIILAGCGDDGTSGSTARVPSYTIETLAGTGVQGEPLENATAAGQPLQGPTTAQVDYYGVVYIADQTHARYVSKGIVRNVRPTGATGAVQDLAVSGVTFESDGVGVEYLFGPVLMISTDDRMLRYFTSATGPIGADGYPTDYRGFIAVNDDGELRLATGDGGQVMNISFEAPWEVIWAGRAGRTGARAQRCVVNDHGAGPFACLRTAGPIVWDARPVPGQPLYVRQLDLYIADTMNHRVRKLTWTGVITTVAGGGGTQLIDDAVRGFSGDGGPGERARLNEPRGVAFDADTNIYISDAGNRRIRMVDTEGIIHTIAGNGERGDGGDGGPALQASFCEPRGLSVDGAGNVYVADTCNYKVRVLRPVREAGTPTP
jgi:hypothetical protein